MTEIANDEPIKTIDEWYSAIFDTDDAASKGHKEAAEEDNPASLARKSLERLTMHST